MTKRWKAIVLAAGRGPDDPMARAYGVLHKCAIPIAGVPMLRRVVETLLRHPAIQSVTVSIDNTAVAKHALGNLASQVTFAMSSTTAAESAISAIEQQGSQFPVLLTTGDHPLLSPAILDCFLSDSGSATADLCVGLASAEIILQKFPQVRRTFLTFRHDSVSGCNLYALTSSKSLVALRFWSSLEQVRKKPWRLVGAFGFVPLLQYILGTVNLAHAFEIASRRLKLAIIPVKIPYAEASIDVDKPSDKELVESILLQETTATT